MRIILLTFTFICSIGHGVWMLALDRIGSGFVDKDDILQAFFFQDPDRERLVRIERHAKLLVERQRIGRIDSLILLLNPLLIAGLAFVMTTVYEAGKTVAVWFLGVPVFALFIMFVIVFVNALVGFL
jgi:type IV secretory pathway TrbD component